MEQLQLTAGYSLSGGEMEKEYRILPQWQLALWWENTPVGGGKGGRGGGGIVGGDLLLMSRQLSLSWTQFGTEISPT